MILAEPDDTDRLIQEVLADLGWQSDARTIADKVRQLEAQYARLVEDQQAERRLLSGLGGTFSAS